MSREISRAETYETVHSAFSQINFNAFDYNTVKQSLIDYLKIYFSEDFNDFIESSELIAIIETFAYVAELLSYRIDMNAQENFMSTAQRKESILRLAKLVSYRPTRNIPHRGLVKITSIRTTEAVFDIDGINLANTTVNWNDANNSNWRDQFNQLMNQVLAQPFGTVGADNRAQVDNVLFELYSLNSTTVRGTDTNSTSAFNYSANVADQTLNMELVPTRLTKDGPIESRPEVDVPFSLMYASDGLGDASDTTGFLVLTKQGTLQKREAFFDGITPNQTLDIAVNNINHTDVFINNVNSDDRRLLVNNPFQDILRENSNSSYGEWFEVGADNFENIAFNTKENRRKYEVETLDNDQIRIIFGDGEFAEIPNGAFDIWFRTSNNSAITIPKSAIVGRESSFSYIDNNGSVQTFTFTFNLINALQNNSVSETLEHIRQTAPSVYYTQDRMVNARDYNTYLLQDPRILKLKAINRTFAGDSKYIAWHDPKEYYEDVKIFGDDLAIFRQQEPPVNGARMTITEASDGETLLENNLEPLLNTVDYFLMVTSKLEELNILNRNYRSIFNGDATSGEKMDIIQALNESILNTNSSGTIGSQLSLYYSVEQDQWFINEFNSSYLLVFQIQPTFTNGNNHSGWVINQATSSIVAHSNTTRFFNTNESDVVLNLNSLTAEMDSLTILAANVDGTGTAILGNDVKFNVTQQASFGGLDQINSLSILPPDDNNDSVPDDISQVNIFGDFVDSRNLNSDEVPNTFELPSEYLLGFEDEDVSIIVIRNGARMSDAELSAAPRTELIFGQDWATPALGNPINTDPSTILRTWIQIQSSATQPDDVYLIRVNRYVYLSRNTINENWTVREDSESIKLLFFQEETSNVSERLYSRYIGRFPLNFSWFHSTPRLNLIDPAPSNIVDMFVITEGYFRDFSAYLNEIINFSPEAPSSYVLGQNFRELLRSKMISDTVVMHSGKLRPLFGSKAQLQDQAKIKIILSSQNTFSDNDIKNQIIGIVQEFFNISSWNFGETFYFSELSAAIHARLNSSLDSVVLVPSSSDSQFGDLYQIDAREDEIFIPDLNAGNIEIIQSLTPNNIRQ